MKFSELAGDLQRRGPAPVYWVTGEEDYLRDRAIALIRSAVLGRDAAGEHSAAGEPASPADPFNDILLYGDETDGAEIVSAAREAPFGPPGGDPAARRLVVVKSADKLPAREAEPLLGYLEAPSETTTLIVASHKLDGRQKFPQALREKAVVVDCGPLPEAQIPGWIRTEAQRLGIQLDEQAVLLLKDLAGESLYFVRQELEKLASFVPPHRVVGVADVEAVRGAFPGASVFDLTDAIAAGDRGRALYIIARNLEAGEAPLRILGSLVWQYRRIWKAQELVEERRSDGEVARVLGVPPFRVRELLAQVKRFPPRHLQQAFRLFLKADSDLKGGSAGTGVRVLEALLLELCADRVPPASPRTPPPWGADRRVTRLSNVRTVRSGRTPAR